MINLEGFEAYLIEDELSENTRSSYLDTMKKFAERYDDFTKENALAFKVWYMKTYKPKSVNNRICGLEKYGKFIGELVHLKRVKEHKVACVENVISAEQYERLIRGLQQDNNIRFLVIVKLLAKTGGRISEVVRYRKCDVLRGYVDMETKGKIRRIYFPKSLYSEISEYISDLDDKEFLCKSRYGKQITARGVSENLRRMATKYNIPKEVMHPHSFRHFFAIEFLKRNNNISLLADLLGHSGVNTTMIYLRMSQEEQKSAIDEAVNW